MPKLIHALLLTCGDASNPLTGEALRRAIGCEVEEVAPEALGPDNLAGTPRDVIVIEQCGAGLASASLALRLRTAGRHAATPIVVVADAGRRDLRIAALEAGANDVLERPLDPEELRARVLNLLKAQDSHRALLRRADSLGEAMRRAVGKIESREEEIVSRLSRAASYRDAETGDHVTRMARCSALIAQALGFESDTCRFLYLAAHMHDIGKIGVPEAILWKEGQLTAEERAEMERHTLIGETILEGSPSPLIALAALIAGSHHERWDGSGYPRGLKGEDIPIAARIAAVADVFDALLSARAYKVGWPPDQARALLVAERGRHFDPACVDALLSRWSEALAIAQREEKGAAAA